MKKGIFIIVLFLLTTQGFAQNYYADIEIEINQRGTTTIQGISSIPSLETPFISNDLTSRNGDITTFNLTTFEEVDSFVYELTLPEDTKLTYLKTTPNIRFDESDGKRVIIGSGNNRPLTIIAQYEHTNSNNYSTYFIIASILVVLIVIILTSYKFIRKKSKSSIIVTPRQREILDIINKKQTITQKELESLVSIPKSSLSRNLKTLEVKGYIKKTQVGHTNYISSINSN